MFYQRMNEKFFNSNDTADIALLNERYTKYVERQEKYLFIERDKGRKICFNDATAADPNADVIETISKQNRHKVLMEALTKLKPSEMQIIDECFFSEKKTITELARLHKISQPTYSKKLNRILLKLRRYIVSYAEIIDF